MRSASAVLLSSLACIVFLSGCSQERERERKRPDTPVAAKTEDEKPGQRLNDGHEISLNAVFSTIPQKHLQEISGAFNSKMDGRRIFVEPFGQDLEKICARLLEVKEPDVFLVRGNDLTAAVKAASRRFLDGIPADAAIDPEDGKAHKALWLVFYIGAGPSSPPMWHVQSIRLEKTEVSVRFTEPSWGTLSQTCDIHQYLAWAPVGELAPGNYSLKLENATKAETVRKRLVLVEKK